MKKINILLGKTLSGKSTVCNILAEKYNIERVISFTTRPMRPGEVHKVDYLFYDSDAVLLLLIYGRIVALRSYQPHIDYGPYPWYYGFVKSDILSESKPFLITDFKGLKDMEREFGKENINSIYLDVSSEVQHERLKRRKEESHNEQIRRIADDNKAFDGIVNHVDHVISANLKPETIAKRIKDIIEA